MAKIDSKSFKKRYAGRKDVNPSAGNWSGRGTAIPAAGGMGGGDDAQQKIGRPKRPYYQGDSGSPNMAADAGFSSYLSRVNKGYDDYEPGAMFPEQEEHDDNSYSGNESLPGTRKLPRSFKKMNRKLSFNENTIVSETKYSVSDLFNFSPSANTNEGIGRMALKLVPAGLKSIGLAIPGFDIALGTALAAYDTSRIRSATDSLVTELNIPENTFLEALASDSENQWQEIIQLIGQSDTELIKSNFDELLGGIKSLLLTLVQSLDTPATVIAGQAGPQVAAPEELVTVPLANIATGIGGFVGEMVPIERWLFDLSTDGAANLEQLVGGIASAGPETQSEIDSMAEEGGPSVTAMFMNPVKTFRRLGDFYTALHSTEEKTPSELVNDKIESTYPSAYTANTNKGSNMSKGDLYAAILANDSNLSEVRNLVKEAISTFQRPYPNGYAYREVPEVEGKTDEEEFDVADDYDNFSVSYRVDGGNVAYQRRNKMEEANLYRWGILAGIEESKKKISNQGKIAKDEKLEDEVDEVNAVANLGGGPALPLGDSTPTFGRKRKSPAKAAGEAFGNAVPIKSKLKQIK